MKKILFIFVLCLGAGVSAGSQDKVTIIGEPSGVPTFESIGISADYSGDLNNNSRGRISYKVHSATEWRPGHPLYRDDDRKQYRGSIVHLLPGTEYDVKLDISDPDGAPDPVEFSVGTWADEFPVADTVFIGDTGSSIIADRPGTPDGYILYMPAEGKEFATVNVNNSEEYCLQIRANYIMIRGLKLHGASRHGIYIQSDLHDLIIENCEITNWGPAGNGELDNWNYRDASAIWGDPRIRRVVVQNNVIHSPRGGSNSWADGHPHGPQALSFSNNLEGENTGGNHVIRYNHFYSTSTDHYYNDVIGGEHNFRDGPFPEDCDIYGNILGNCFDDAIEIDSKAENVRVWGNVLTECFVGISTQRTQDDPVLNGPVYIWRNLIINNTLPEEIPSATGFKIAHKGGPVFLYHNTFVQPDGVSRGVQSVSDVKSENITGINNIFNCMTNSGLKIIDTEDLSGPTNWFNYNCYNATVYPYGPSIGPDMVTENVIFEQVGDYHFLPEAGQEVIDAGVIIHNFNDRYLGKGPDIGACEAGGDTFQLGPQETIHYGIFYNDTLKVSDEENLHPVIPQVLTCQAAPNPFTQVLNVDLILSEASNTSVNVFDLYGKHITTVLDRKLYPGNHNIYWDVSGKILPGIYLLNIKTDTCSRCIKVAYMP